MATLWSKLCLKSHYHKDNEVQIKRAEKFHPSFLTLESHMTNRG